MRIKYNQSFSDYVNDKNIKTVVVILVFLLAVVMNYLKRSNLHIGHQYYNQHTQRSQIMRAQARMLEFPSKGEVKFIEVDGRRGDREDQKDSL